MAATCTSVLSARLYVRSEVAQPDKSLRHSPPQAPALAPFAQSPYFQRRNYSLWSQVSHSAIGPSASASAFFLSTRNSPGPPAAKTFTDDASGTASAATETSKTADVAADARQRLEDLKEPSALPAVELVQTSQQEQQQQQQQPLSKRIRVIATDVDGTLLDSQQQLRERTETALKLAMEQGVQVVLATGKARGPWFPEIQRRLQLSCPAVFLQGLLVYSADGTILHERNLEKDVAREIVDVANTKGITLVAYCSERILCRECNWHTDRLVGYGEPVPEAVGDLGGVIESTPIHKLLFMAEDSTLAILRRELEVQLAGKATLVTALHGMLEVLPLGASKAVGLRHVLGMLGVDESQVLAAGDGENDVEMLRMAGFAVAMGNAGDQLKLEADFVSSSNDQDGLALAVEKFVLQPGYWS